MSTEQNKTLTLGSLFAGSGGFELGGLLAGIQPVWNCEVEPFPIRVTTKRLPQVIHYGDISSLRGAELPPVDIITGGFPCQSVSVAGKREGVQHIDHGGEKTTRSGLFYEAVRIIKEMREATDGENPRYFVVENVPGLFSSKSGEDFKSVLEEIIAVKEPEAPPLPMPEKGKWATADIILGDGWSVAYRTLDAQHFGLAQRRKRLFLVADFAGQSAGKVLFKSEGLSRYSPESFRAWQRAAASSESGIGTASCAGRIGLNKPGEILEAAGFCTEHSANARSIGYEEERSPTLRAGVVPAAIALENHPADSRVKISEDGKVQTLTSRCGTGGGNVPLVMDGADNSPAVTLKIRSGCEGGGKGAIWQEEKSATLGCNNDQTLFVPKCYGVCSKASHSMMSDNPHSGFYEAETSRTLDRSGGAPTCNQGGICVVEPVAFTQNQRDEVRDLGDKSAALAAEPGMKQQTFVVQPEDVTAFHVNQRNELIDLHGKSGALMATRSDQMQTFVLQGNMIGRKDENGPQGDGVNEDVCFTLDATDRHAVCAPEDMYAMTTGSFMRVEENVSPTLMARDYKDPTTIAPAPHLNEGVAGTVASGAHPSGFNGQDAFNDRLVIDNPEAQSTSVTYTVRRLTPTECARLQGFPDWWCRDLGTENPTEEELAFWADVFETHRKIVTHAKKPKTEKQIRKWLADPYSDAAEYKLWGNGVALPCVYFVLAGIAWCAGLEE